MATLLLSKKLIPFVSEFWNSLLKFSFSRFLMFSGSIEREHQHYMGLLNFANLQEKFKFNLLLGNFNACADDETMKDFCSSYCLKSLIKQVTCFKNPEDPSYVNLILTNKPRSFHSRCVIEIELSDFHRITVSVSNFWKIPRMQVD